MFVVVFLVNFAFHLISWGALEAVQASKSPFGSFQRAGEGEGRETRRCAGLRGRAGDEAERAQRVDEDAVQRPRALQRNGLRAAHRAPSLLREQRAGASLQDISIYIYMKLE